MAWLRCSPAALALALTSYSLATSHTVRYTISDVSLYLLALYMFGMTGKEG